MDRNSRLAAESCVWLGVSQGMPVHWAIFHLEVTQLWARLLGCQPWLCLILAMWPGYGTLGSIRKNWANTGPHYGMAMKSQRVNTCSKSLARAWLVYSLQASQVPSGCLERAHALGQNHLGALCVCGGLGVGGKYLH